jgi:hypothetical protein
MKVRDLAATLLCITLTLGLSQAVHADPNPNPPGKPPPQTCALPLHTVILAGDHDCVEELVEVWNAIDDLPDGRDETNLKLKVCAADNKLHIDPPKTQDAIDKLINIKDTVGTKRKIVEPHKSNIIAAADKAIACLVPTL